MEILKYWSCKERLQPKKAKGASKRATKKIPEGLIDEVTRGWATRKSASLNGEQGLWHAFEQIAVFPVKFKRCNSE